MNKPNRYNPTLKILTHIFCVIIGITFIGSGFVKAIDPWGTAVKFEEYFTVYGLNFMLPLSRVLAVWLCGAEMMMGCMILCRVRLRLISIFALVSMSIFTIITILSVTLFPVDDCGCFGDAMYMTPRQTLAKNLVLLPMIITIWWRYRPDKILVYKQREVVLATIFCITTMSFSAYNYLYLPMIDFLPYKVGVDLLSEIEATTSSIDYNVVLVYRNIASGELREFSIDEQEWHNTEEWEWVETRTGVKDNGRVKSLASDFSLRSFGGDNATIDLLSHGGELNILAVTDLEQLRPRCKKRIEEYVAAAAQEGDYTIIATSAKLSNAHYNIGNESIECYTIDATTLKSIMRAKVGVIELTDGVIQSKRSCIDL